MDTRGARWPRKVLLFSLSLGCHAFSVIPPLSGSDYCSRSRNNRARSQSASTRAFSKQQPTLFSEESVNNNTEDGDFDNVWQDDDDDDDEFVLYEDDDYSEDYTSSGIPAISLDDLSTTLLSPNNVSYFYLQNELGLSEKAMWRITYEAGSSLGMTASTIRHKVDVLREAMHLSLSDTQTLLEHQPTLLHLSAEENLVPTMEFLKVQLQLSTDDLRQLVLASPSILTYQESNLQAKIRFFTRDMGYSVRQCRNLWLSEPKLMRAGVRTGLQPRLRFLTKDLEIPMEQVRKIIEKNPKILIYSLDNNLIPKLIFFLIMTLHMDTAQIQRLLLSYPALLDYNLDNHILPISRYFLQDLEYSPTELRSVLLKFPRLWTYSLQNIKHMVGYLRYEVGLTGSQVKRVLFQAPQVISLREGHVKAKLEFLRTAFQLTPCQVQTVVAGMPTLLVLSLASNLQPKRDYLLHAFDGDSQALGDAVLRLPTLLGYSLDKRIRPRMEAIQKSGLRPARITVGIPMKQEKFEGWLQRRATKEQMVERGREADLAVARTRALLPLRKALPPAKEEEKEPERIVHWTRDRRPLSGKSQ